MSSSRAVVLSDLFDVNPKRSLAKGHESTFVSMADLAGHQRSISSWKKRPFKSGSRFQNGDVLVARITPCLENGKTAFVDILDEGAVGHGSTEFIVLAAKDGMADPLFGYYLATSPRFRDFATSRMIGSSGRQRVSAGEIGEYRLEYAPTLDEQRAIAELLGSFDDRFVWLSYLIDQLEALGAELLHGTLLRHGLSSDQPLGPDARVKIDNFIEVLESGTRPKGGVGSIHKGIPSIGAESIEGAGRFDFSRTRFVPVDFFATMRRGHVEDRDVLVYKDGGKPGQFIPHVSIAGDQFPFDRCVINDHVYRVRTRQPYGQAFLYFWLRTQQSTQEMALRGTGAAQPGLNQTNFRDVPLPRLPESELLQLDEQLDHLLTLMFRAAREQQSLSSMRDTLLPRLVSGELRIEDPERLLDRVA